MTAPGHTIGKRAEGKGKAGPHLGKPDTKLHPQELFFLICALSELLEA